VKQSDRRVWFEFDHRCRPDVVWRRHARGESMSRAEVSVE
jgi:hypothetical protein